MVSIQNGQLVTLWDIQVGGEYQPSINALAEYVRSCPIENVFLHCDPQIGTDKNFEQTEKEVLTWEHFHVTLTQALQCSTDQRGPKESEYRAQHDVLLRSLKEIIPDAIETVLDLVSQDSLYRGSEKKALLEAFQSAKRQFDALTTDEDLFVWSQVAMNPFICRMRNDVIGTLLVDLSEGVELEKAVKSFEDKVSGTNYKRPTALVTPRMRDNAKQALVELGLMSALDRRYAKLEDIRVTDVLFADRSAKRRMKGDVFDEVVTKGQSQNFDKVEEIPIEKFIADILPTAKSLEVLFENRQTGNLVSLIAPEDLTAKSLFKWDNPFSWSYNGDVADSIKERVKQAGGNVTGDVCCRLAWYNFDDLDLHMKEANGNEIYYMTKRSTTGGQLDVDMNAGGGSTRTPVENIFYNNWRLMPKGNYQLFVHQYSKRETTNVGFDVQIDILGTVHEFHYSEAVKSQSKVTVAFLNVTASGVEVIPALPSSQAVREVWGIQTQEFRPVTAMMLSPNFWEGSLGNKHYFFMLDGCKNDGSARGFYNEFLSSEFEPHRKTMEIVGSKMRTDQSDDQMSGLGFSSTQRNHLICKVHGSFSRTIKLLF